MTQETPKVSNAKELLSEAKRLFKDFFQRGYMTLQTAGDRWKQYHQAVATAKEALWTPLLLAKQIPSLTPESTPLVMVTRSNVAQFHPGTRLSLAEANQRIQSTGTPGKLEVQIDFYTANGPDRYQTELTVGPGAESIQKQIAQRIEAARQADMGNFFEAVPAACRDSLQAGLSPALTQSFTDISAQLVECLTEHCAISHLEQQLETQASLMPQAAQQQFRETMQESIAIFRRSTNSRPLTPPTQERTGRENSIPHQQANSRQSVKIKLQAMQNKNMAARPRSPRPKER